MKTVLILALLLWGNSAFAAEPPTEGSDSAGVTGGTTGSMTPDCGANINRYLHVVAVFQSNVAAFSTLTYAGVAISILDTSSTAGGNRVVVAKLVAPASGVNTLAFVSDTVTNIAIVAACFSDVDQTAPHGTLVAANALTAAATAGTDGVVVDAMVYTASGGPYVSHVSQTEIEQVDNGDDSVHIAMSTKAGSGSVTMLWTDSPGGCCFNRILLLPINKAAAAASSGFFARRRAQ